MKNGHNVSPSSSLKTVNTKVRVQMQVISKEVQIKSQVRKIKEQVVLQSSSWTRVLQAWEQPIFTRDCLL